MNSRRLSHILVGALILLITLSFVSTYLGRQMLVEKSEKLRKLRAEISADEQQERSLIEAKEEIAENVTLASVAKSIVPQEKDQARTVRELITIAESVGVTISSISFPSSELGNSKQKNNAPTQLQEIEDIPGLSRLQVSVTVDEPIPYDTVLDFLERLEQNRRTSAISSVIINPTTDAQSLQTLLDFELILQVYIKQ